MFFINLNDLEFVIVSWELVDQVLFDIIQYVKNSIQIMVIKLNIGLLYVDKGLFLLEKECLGSKGIF